MRQVLSGFRLFDGEKIKPLSTVPSKCLLPCSLVLFSIFVAVNLSQTASPSLASPRIKEPSVAQASTQQAQLGALQLRASSAMGMVASQAVDIDYTEVRGRLNPQQIEFHSKLDPAILEIEPQTYARLRELPRFETMRYGSFAGRTAAGDIVYYTLDPELQDYTKRLVSRARAGHIAIAVMEPFTGRVLALAGKSNGIKDIELHGEFPAASLFKIVTSAAALEQSSLRPNSAVFFRGGNYTLNHTNYRPDRRRDNRQMTVSEALGRSCNPVFARIALNDIEPHHLNHYAAAFGFNSSLGSDLPISISRAEIPDGDYQLTRTAAGFGRVTINSLHAAALMSSVANGGILPRPTIIQRVITADGDLLYYGRPQALRRAVAGNTAEKLMDMLETTTTIGTSSREFMRNRQPVMGRTRVAAKTGTLSGQNPAGLNNLFIAAAPIENPQIAVAVIVNSALDQSARASAIGRQILEHQLLGRHRD